MFAIEFDQYIDRMRGSFSPSLAMDKKSRELLMEFYALIDIIKPCGEDDRKEFWIRIPCGTYEEVMAEYPDDDEYTKEEFLQEYPDKEKWYRVTAQIYRDKRREEDVYSVFIDREYVLAVGNINMRDMWPANVSDFVNALIGAAKVSVDAMKAGTYNDLVRDCLPYKKRYGRISRKDYWDIFPEKRAAYRSCFSDRDWEEFSSISIQKDTLDPDVPLLSSVTARQYFEACAAGYKAAGVKMRRKPGENCLCERDPEEEIARYHGEYTPREWYKAIAEGRDDGLTRVPLDDPEAFAEWLGEKGPYYEFNGSHPWEVIPSGNISASLHFYVRNNRSFIFTDDDIEEKAKGYSFGVSGSVLWRSPETIAFYLAVKRAGYPVVLYDAKKLQARLLEEDDVGIVPYFSFYGGPDSRIGYDVPDLISLDEEEGKIKEIIARARWMPENTVILKEKEKGNEF